MDKKAVAEPPIITIAKTTPKIRPFLLIQPEEDFFTLGVIKTEGFKSHYMAQIKYTHHIWLI